MSDKPRRKAAAKPPVSAHPAFPAIVAVWFAALLGLGTLVLPASLYGALIEASGLSQVVLAAQPPLGPAARLAVALAAAGVGAIGGLAVARRVVAATRSRPFARNETGPLDGGFVRRPLSVHEDFGENGIDAAELQKEQPFDLDPALTAQPAAAQAPAAAQGAAIVELVDRFARALQQHREHAATTAQTSDGALIDVTAALSGEQAPHEAAPPPSGPAPFAVAHPLRFDEFDDDDDSNAEAEESYSSLLGIHRSFRQPRKPALIHGDDASDEAEGTASEPVAIFPGQGGGRAPPPHGPLPARAAAASDTERALREALEKLEKMSGTA